MNSPLPVEISRLAAQHIRELESWWRRNRTAAPNAVRVEIERALSLITLHPYTGPRAFDVDLENVRRIHLSRIWHFLYYRVHDDPLRVELLALWSESRGEGPPI
jgi:plasmid stabilization system protein ParE